MTASPGGDGMSWGTAFASVQPAIDDAAANEPCEVWVAAGSYYIYETANTDHVMMQSGVDLYGGFNGTETARGQRDWTVNVTVLDGRAGSGSSNRVLHVVEAASNARLDGFVVRQGLSNGAPPPTDRGAGLYSDATDVVIANCSFVDNDAGWGGGGIVFAGGMPTIIDTEIANNTAGLYGGAVFSDGSSMQMSRCIVHDNSSGNDGGGIVLAGGAGGSPLIQNSIFYGQQGGDFGGAMDIQQGSAALVVNNTFYNNHGPHGGGAICARSDYATVSNNVALGNTGTYGPDILQGGTFTPTITYNCYPNPLPNNIDASAQFVNAGAHDFHMTSTSPCIDIADDSVAPAVDYDGVSRVDIPGVGTPGTLADAGAFEYSP